MDSLDRYLKYDMYDTAIDELNEGYKESHWIWAVFPQLNGLGDSEECVKYELNGVKEAELFVKNKKCRSRLIKALNCVIRHENKTEIQFIFQSFIDCKKFLSCLTLFYNVSKHNNDTELQNITLILIKWAHKEGIYTCDYTQDKCDEYYET